MLTHNRRSKNALGMNERTWRCPALKREEGRDDLDTVERDPTAPKRRAPQGGCQSAAGKLRPPVGPGAWGLVSVQLERSGSNKGNWTALNYLHCKAEVKDAGLVRMEKWGVSMGVWII